MDRIYSAYLGTSKGLNSQQEFRKSSPGLFKTPLMPFKLEGTDANFMPKHSFDTRAIGYDYDALPAESGAMRELPTLPNARCPSLDPVVCGSTLAGVTPASSAGTLAWTWTRNGDSPIAIALSALRLTDLETAPKQSIGDVTATGLAVSNPVHLQFGEFDKACTREVEGTLRFSNGALQVCVSSAWKTISLQS